MRKMVKVLIIVVVAVVVAGTVALFAIDRIARTGVELGATSALGVDTTVEGVSIKILRQGVAISGLKIANPEGYKTDRLMALGLCSVKCDVLSLLTDEAHINEIIVDAPELTIELKPGLPPKSNLGELLDNMESGRPSPEEEQGQTQFKIDLIRVTKTKVRFHTLDGGTADVVLPDIELRDVSNADGSPVLMADIFRQVLAEMTSSAFELAKGAVTDGFRTTLDETLNSANDLIGTGIGDQPKKVINGIKGIFGKKK